MTAPDPAIRRWLEDLILRENPQPPEGGDGDRAHPTSGGPDAAT